VSGCLKNDRGSYKQRVECLGMFTGKFAPEEGGEFGMAKKGCVPKMSQRA